MDAPLTKVQETNPLTVLTYLREHGYVDTANCFDIELQGRDRRNAKTERLLSAFDAGRGQDFFALSKQHSKFQNHEEPLVVELIFWCQLHFALYHFRTPKRHKEAPRERAHLAARAMINFQRYLGAGEGKRLSRDARFNDYVQLPSVVNPILHDVFSPCFRPRWLQDIRQALVDHLEESGGRSNEQKIVVGLSDPIVSVEDRWREYRQLYAFTSELVQIFTNEMKDTTTAAFTNYIQRRFRSFDGRSTSIDGCSTNPPTPDDIIEQQQEVELNFPKLKLDLENKPGRFVCLLLQALRWRLLKDPKSVRLEYIREDILPAKLLERLHTQGSEEVVEMTLRLVNVLYRGTTGREYCLAHVPTIISVLKSSKILSNAQTTLALAVLQKMSGHSLAQSPMFDELEFFVTLLSPSSTIFNTALSLPVKEKLLALLMNLGSSASGRHILTNSQDRCERWLAIFVHFLSDGHASPQDRSPDLEQLVYRLLLSLLNAPAFHQYIQTDGRSLLRPILDHASDPILRQCQDLMCKAEEALLVTEPSEESKQDQQEEEEKLEDDDIIQECIQANEDELDGTLLLYGYRIQSQSPKGGDEPPKALVEMIQPPVLLPEVEEPEQRTELPIVDPDVPDELPNGKFLTRPKCVHTPPLGYARAYIRSSPR